MDVLIALVGVLAVVHTGYSLWTAKRLDRLHRRVDTARAALDAQLRQRADAAASFAAGPRDVARSGAAARELHAAAAAALAVPGLGHDREAAENALSRSLQEVADAATTPLVDAATRASFARRFHNDAVRDALVVRRRRIVRYFHLYGHAPLPTFFEMDDSALDRRTIEV